MLNRLTTAYSSSQALRWVADIAYGLAAMHELQPMVLHRDVKKENVMLVESEGRVMAKLVDFGLAKVRGEY